ncbi:Hypothetical predicted protein [Podarcis lilfordi]|uniref:Uncharacterized protein n=1 Tax=Podarcis lilfordi TaxID=74358 RepID=A0AA35PMC7_9SAUR|nr:Hypothetical predicted protein [Podarcis lilfordi]
MASQRLLEVTFLPAEQLLEAKCFLASDLAVESIFEPWTSPTCCKEFSGKAVEVEEVLADQQQLLHLKAEQLHQSPLAESATAVQHLTSLMHTIRRMDEYKANHFGLLV